MTNAAGNEKDISLLRQFYQENAEARDIFNYFAKRRKNSRITKMETLLKTLEDQGQAISRAKVVKFFRVLEETGCGNYIEGRWEHKSRFEWYKNLIDVGQAAAGNTGIIKEIPAESNDLEETEVEMLPHEYRLRPEQVIHFDLPDDLTTAEASRLSEFIKTLPFN